MAELTTIARPYAQAVFKLARENNSLEQWSAMLVTAAAVVQDPAMCEVMASARLDREQITTMMIEVCADALDEQGRNLIRLLDENDKLRLLPEIAVVYEHYRAEAEQTIEAEMVSAFPVTESQQEKMASALAKRLGSKVSLDVSVDQTLLGGAIIRAGDMIIDGSVQGKLNKLASAMNH